MYKVCTNCLNEKEINEFYIQSGKPQSQCKSCIKYKASEYRENNRENNKEKLSEYYKLNYINNKEEKKAKSKEYYNSNRDLQNTKNKEYQKNNREKRNKYKREYNSYKRKNNPLFRLTNNIRGGIYNSIIRKGYAKNSNTFSILGCTYYEFSTYLESKFEDWMSWENYGKYNGELNYGWDLDHIIPISSATNEEEVIILNHYTNFQPLCSKINRDIKKHKLIYEN